MVPADVFSTWVALSMLVPLLWQPFINDIKAYSVRYISPERIARTNDFML